MLSTLPGIDRAQTKNQIRDHLLEQATAAGHDLSRSRANNLADKYKKGLYDPELQYILDYSDPTGETAVNNQLQPERCHAATPTPRGLVYCTNTPSTAREAQWHTQYPFCDHHLQEFIAQAGK